MKNKWYGVPWIGSLLLFVAVGYSTCFALTSVATATESPAAAKLLELAKRHFKETISPAEEKLVEAAADGTEADCTALSGKERVIRGELLAWLCTNPEVSNQVTYRGVAISGAEINGEVDLLNAKILFPLQTLRCVFKETIILQESDLFSLSLVNTSIKDLRAGDLVTKDGVYLIYGFKAEGEVDFTGAIIGGNLACDGGQFFSNGEGSALSVSGAKIHGSVGLARGFKAEGEVNLTGAIIDGKLDCEGGQFIGKGNASALGLNSATIHGDVFLRKDFKAEGAVDLTRATIGGNLVCNDGHFIHSGGYAIKADSLKIDGSAFFEGMAAEGVVGFTTAYVAYGFKWSDVKSPEKAMLDLRLTKVGTLFNDQNSWPNHGNLLVDGFVYDQIAGRVSLNAEVQLGWLNRQPRDQFLSQPFEQLASVLRKMGRQEDAVKVMIAKNEDAGRHALAEDRNPDSEGKDLRDYAGRQVNKLLDLCWYKLLGRFIGYGYRPWNAFYASLFIVFVVGWVVFRIGYITHILIPTSESAYGVSGGWTGQLKETYPKFNALIYSLETFVPLVKLNVAENWIPNANHLGHLRLARLKLPIPGTLVRWYLWFHIIAGWVLTTLWVGGLTGLIKS